MKSKKITAWILFMAMLVTMMPSTFVFAADGTPSPYPKIITDVFSAMTNDADGVISGTDLDLVNGVSGKLPVTDATPGMVITDADADADVDDDIPDAIVGAYKKQDKEIKKVRRKQILTFVAQSQANVAVDRTFVDEKGPMKIVPGAVEIAYMDADKSPLILDLNSNFKMIKPSGATSDAKWAADGVWIDLAKDVQITNVVLDTFLNSENNTLHDQRYDVTETDKVIDKEKLTAAQLFATEDMVSFMIYNVVNGDFSGFLRVKITDKAGNVTVQDYPIVADGQYPGVSIETSTEKNPVGEVVATTAKDTFISEMTFKEPIDTIDSDTKKSYRHYKWKDDVNTDGVVEGLEDLKKALTWQDENYKREEIWAMNDINIDKISISDLWVSSGIQSVTYDVKNFTLEENVVPSSLEGNEAKSLVYDPTTGLCDLTSNPIVITDEGFNVLAITVIDNTGLKTTNRYYFFIDKTAPKAEFNLVELDKNVISLLTVADVVTNRQQAIDMSASDDVKASVDVISGFEDAIAGDINENKMYQYRLLATKEGALEGGDVPDGYTATVLDEKGNDLSGWKIWTGETETPVIDKEFDGIVQVRVQDRAGNWSPIVSNVSTDLDDKTTIITDNTNPVIEFNEYAHDESEAGKTANDIKGGTLTDILTSESDDEPAKTIKYGDFDAKEYGIDNENEEVHIYEATAPWINDSAVLEVKITDKDLVNAIRSSGLEKGQITVNAEFHKENQTKEIKIWKKDGSKPDTEDPGLIGNTVEFEIAEEHIFGDDDSTPDYNEADKALTFYLEYEGTGVVDITVSVKDQADVNDGDAFSSIYKTQLRVDKINPYIEFRGMTATCDDKDGVVVDYDDSVEKEGLLKSTGADEYRLRDMPWGPYSQVLEVVVKDDDITPVQSKTKNVKFNANKALDLYKISGDTFTKVETYAAGNNNIVSLGDCEELANEKYESNVGYKFYLVYEGTGIAKVEFFADDSAKEPNVRDYPSVATAADADPVLYDAMLRVDTEAPKFDAVELKETDEDVNDVKLFGLTNVDSKNVTRKQMVVEFDILDNVDTDEQSGVTLRHEKPIIVKENYVSLKKDNLYNNKEVTYSTDDNLTKEASDDNDPLVDYILIPVSNKNSIGTAGTFELKDKEGNTCSIEKLSDDDLKNIYNTEWVKADAATGYWQEDEIVIPDEFQGAIILRTTDRVGNVVYSEPITFVAESKSPLVKFNSEPAGINKWETLNQYGWAKRDVYFEVLVKDQTESDVDAGLAKVELKADVDGVMSLNGDALGTTEKVITNFGTPNTEGYISLGLVKATETSALTVTVYDKADVADTDKTGNKTEATYNVNIDRKAPEVTEDAIKFTVKNNEIKLVVDDAELADADSGIAPLWNTNEYNKHNGFMPLYTVNGVDEKTGADQETLLYYFNSYDDVKDYNSVPSKIKVREGYVHEDDKFSATQFELPGIQYALIPKNGSLKANVNPWDFENLEGYLTEDGTFNSSGYFKTFGVENKWHNYVPGQVVANAEFDGYIVVRVVDKAGNITLLGTSSILDIEFDNDWKNETQFIQVKASEKVKNGIPTETVTEVEYFGNNDLLFPDGVHRSLTEALSGEGAFIEVINEGITNVVIKSKTDIIAADSITLSDWEGAMNIGSLNKDWKYQFVDVKIDKTAPEFELGGVWNDSTKENFNVEIDFVRDPEPSATMSRIPSGIESIEWCKIPTGTSKEEWFNVEKVSIDGVEYKFEEVPDWYVEGIVIDTIEAKEFSAFDGTIKVRVTDKAGNVTEKSQNKNVDGTTPIISISNDSTGKCSHDPVTVFVTVSERAEFSDVQKVEYTITHPVCIKEECTTEDCPLEDHRKEKGSLPLTGGTITVYREGETTVEVTAENKAEKPETAKTTVLIHYNDLKLPTVKGITAESEDKEVVLVSGNWVVENRLTFVNNETMEGTAVWYSVNGAEWFEASDEAIADKLVAGQNIVRIQSRSADCLCKSDVVTYVINYDDMTTEPIIKVDTNRLGEDKWVKGPVWIDVVALQGDVPSAIKYISYELSQNESDFETKYLSSNSGRITFEKDGEYSIRNIKVVFESGRIEYVDGYKVEEGTEGGIPVAKIDNESPEVEFEFRDFGTDDVVDLFGIWDEQTQNKQDVYLTKLNDNGKSMSLTVEYAICEKGTSPNWKPAKIKNQEYDALPVLTTGEYRIFENETEPLINRVFDGTFMLRVTDEAGNTTVVSKTICADGRKPEISITSNVVPFEADGETQYTSGNVQLKVDILNKNLGYDVTNVKYTIVDVITGDPVIGEVKGENENWGNFNTAGGTLILDEEGEWKVIIDVYDSRSSGEAAIETEDVIIGIDKTAPTYSGSVALSMFNVHAINNWDDIHDGWTYNHPVDISGISDSLSGIKEIRAKVTTETGETNEITLSEGQTETSFATDGRYDLAIEDNAGNIRNISFVIDKDLDNVINVIGVDMFGKVHVAVTDGDQMLTFHIKENESGAEEKVINGITDQIWIGETGVFKVYAKDDAGKLTNSVDVFVAPSNNYEITLTSLVDSGNVEIANRYMDIDSNGESVNVVLNDKLFNVGVDETIATDNNSVYKFDQNGIYTITTN